MTLDTPTRVCKVLTTSPLEFAEVRHIGGRDSLGDALGNLLCNGDLPQLVSMLENRQGFDKGTGGTK